MEILLGTGNRHKVEEIAHLLQGMPVKIMTVKDFPGLPEVHEDGRTLEENAVKKAREYSKATGLLTLADDTGLEVDALDGAPGVFSARYAGEQCSYLDNNRKLIAELEKVPESKRTAHFRTVIAVADEKSGFLKTVSGEVRGVILGAMRGQNGFGYDPIFFLPDLNKTLAELTLDEKNQVSHRARALIKAKEVLQERCTGY